MNPSAYMQAFQDKGVILWREGDLLKFRAPDGVLTPPVLAKLVAAKPIILSLLPSVPGNLLMSKDLDLTETSKGGETQSYAGAGEPDESCLGAMLFSPEIQAALASAWEALQSGRMELEWQRGPGCRVPDVAVWLTNRALGIERLKDALGEGESEDWIDTPQGKRIAEELIEFAEFYGQDRQGDSAV